MWTGIVESATLLHANRWTVSYFTETTTPGSSAYQMRPLRELATERRMAVDPRRTEGETIVYIGLENIRSTTGELVEFAPRAASSIKSRSKTFQAGDILFGRLRPELNKVYFAEPPAPEGLCSSEFIILVPRRDLVLPRYLRHVLASSYVTRYASKFIVGASLPRMAPEDLLGIEVPVPPLKVQFQLVEQLERIDKEIVALRAQLAILPSLQAEALVAALSDGTQGISAGMAVQWPRTIFASGLDN